MRLSLPFCLFWMLLFFVHDSRAQIEIDTLTGLPNGKLPFDQPFILKIPVFGKRIGSLAYIQVNRNQDFQKAINIRHRQIEEFVRDPAKNIDEIGTPKKIGNRYYLFAKFLNPHLLAPGRQYTIFWTEDVSDAVLDLFDTYDSATRAGSSLSSAQKQHTALVADYKKRIGIEISFTTGGFDSQVHRNYDSLGLKPLYTNYRDALKNYDSVANSKALYTSLSANRSILTLQRSLIGPTPLIDKSVRKKYLPDPQLAINRLQKLLTLDEATYRKLLNGIESVDCDRCEATPDSHVEERATNIASTFTAVETLYDLTQILQLAGQSGLTDAETKLRNFRDELRLVKKKFTDEVVKARTPIRDALFVTGLSEPRKLSGDTYVPVFETRTKMSITPDFGLVTTRAFRPFRRDMTKPHIDLANPYDFVPYLGFQINLRPINRDVTFWSYKHKPLHFVSLMIGYSLVSVDNGPKQSFKADSVKSFFGGGKGALLTGGGIRLGNLVRVTAGTMWYFQYTATDPAKPNVYDRRFLKNWPYVGIALDMSFKDLFNGISDVFSQSPRRLPAAAPTDVQTPAN